jgi:hypothetical protein
MTCRILETAHTIFVWVYLYDITVTNYGNPVALTGSPWTLGMSSALDGVIGGTVQVYITSLISPLLRLMPLPGLFRVPSLCGIGLSDFTHALLGRVSFAVVHIHIRCCSRIAYVLRGIRNALSVDSHCLTGDCYVCGFSQHLGAGLFLVDGALQEWYQTVSKFMPSIIIPRLHLSFTLGPECSWIS